MVSKVISGLSTHQAHRRRKDTVMGSSVGTDAWAQIREPKGTIGTSFEPTFHAGLTNNPNAKTPGGHFLPATVTRATSATYVDINGILRVAGVNESRQEYLNGQPLGTLMEDDATNKCTNYNANPDAALTGLNLAGPGTIYRVNDAEELQAAGLDRICSDGNVIAIDARGVGTTFCYVDAEVGNTNAHAISAYCKAAQGSGFLGLSDGVSGESFSNPNLTRITTVQTPDLNTRRLTVFANGDSLVYFVLNQLEEQPVPTSTIITSGTATSRAVDQLTWPLTDTQGRSILNQSQGMAAVTFQPKYASSDLASTTVQGLVSLFDSAISLLYHNRTAGIDAFVTTTRGTGGDSTAVSIAGGFAQNALMVLTSRWNTAVSLQVSFKRSGAWSTGGGTISTQWENDGIMRLSRLVQLPMYMRDLYMWDEDRGQPWLESFFSGTAN